MSDKVEDNPQVIKDVKVKKSKNEPKEKKIRNPSKRIEVTPDKIEKTDIELKKEKGNSNKTLSADIYQTIDKWLEDGYVALRPECYKYFRNGTDRVRYVTKENLARVGGVISSINEEEEFVGFININK
jgi:predicted transcriptional regulator